MYKQHSKGIIIGPVYDLREASEDFNIAKLNIVIQDHHVQGDFIFKRQDEAVLVESRKSFHK